MRTRSASAATSIIVALLATVLIASPIPANADESYRANADTTFTLMGRGFGHGRGMSQYGAYRAGSIGITGRAITDRYYAGSTLSTIGNPLYRVQISSAEGDRFIMFPPVQGLTVRDEQTMVERRIDANAIPVASIWRVAADAAGLRVQYRASSGEWISIGIGDRTAFGGTVRLYTNEQPTMPVLDEDESSQRPYRGNFRIHRLDAARLSVVNVVPLETYLQSVVPSESPSSWPAASLQAQAIAARSYAGYYYRLPRAGHYDICDTISCQVYSGSAKERASTNDAVSTTAGQARMMGQNILRAEFSSSNGGWASQGAAGHGGPGYDDWSDGSWDPSHRWRVSVSSADLGAMVSPGYRLTRMLVMDRDGVGDWGGRVTSVRLYATSPGGATATKDVTGDDIRRRFGLRSTLFTLEQSGEVRWQVTSGLSTNSRSSTHTWGPKGSWLLMGDWNGDGVSTPGIVNSVNHEWRWRMSSTNEIGPPVSDFLYGPTSCRPVAGDWDGNGTDTPGLACASGDSTRWRLSNVNGRSAPAADFRFGPADARPVVGRWVSGMTGDGVGTAQPVGGDLQWQLRNATSAGAPWAVFNYGAASDRPVTGDWDGNGTTDIGVTRPSGERWLWRLRSDASPGASTHNLLAGLTNQGTLVADRRGQPSLPVLTG